LLAAGLLTFTPSAQAVEVPFFSPQVISNSADGAFRSLRRTWTGTGTWISCPLPSQTTR
jgi:hypothetical protein